MVDIEKLKKLVSENLSNKEISIELNIDVSKIKKLLFKHRILRSVIKHCNCIICDVGLGDNKDNRSTCKRCSQRINRYRRKLKCINYLGGKCVMCGFDKYVSALEFHHRESNEKEYQISKQMCNNFEDVKKELDKCDLLCSNCHSEVHSNYNDKKLIEYINKNNS